MLGSVVFATVIIGGAFILARGAAAPPTAEASEEAALLAAIATRDSDSDGLTDWEEALYGTDPQVSDTRGLGMTDGEAVAQGLIVPKAIADIPQAGAAGTVVDPDLPPAPAEGTLTAAFAQSLFTSYFDALKESGGQLTDADLADITNQALAALGTTVRAAPPFKRADEIRVEGAGAEALRTYAAAVERVMQANTAEASKSELEYLADVVKGGDTSGLASITSLAKAYRMSAAGVAALPVPTELAATHLALVNSLAHLSEVTNDFALVNSDPLVAMLALEQYPQAVSTLIDSFIAIAKTYRAAGIELTPGEPGASIVNLVDDIAAEQAAAKKP